LEKLANEQLKIVILPVNRELNSRMPEKLNGSD
jgi:hypothetical protein